MIRLHVSQHWARLLTATLSNLGGSLGDRGPSTQLDHICRGLNNWLNATLGVESEDLGDTLPTGRQMDRHSCGVCVINVMEHAVFGVPLFMDRDHYRLRIQCFVTNFVEAAKMWGPVLRQKEVLTSVLLVSPVCV